MVLMSRDPFHGCLFLVKKPRHFGEVRLFLTAPPSAILCNSCVRREIDVMLSKHSLKLREAQKAGIVAMVKASSS